MSIFIASLAAVATSLNAIITSTGTTFQTALMFGAYQDIVHGTGLHQVLATLPKGYDTLLTRSYFDLADKEDPQTGVFLSTVLISHRLNAIRDADRILVLVDGEPAMGELVIGTLCLAGFVFAAATRARASARLMSRNRQLALLSVPVAVCRPCRFRTAVTIASCSRAALTTMPW